MEHMFYALCTAIRVVLQLNFALISRLLGVLSALACSVSLLLRCMCDALATLLVDLSLFTDDLMGVASASVDGAVGAARATSSMATRIYTAAGYAVTLAWLAARAAAVTVLHVVHLAVLMMLDAVLTSARSVLLLCDAGVALLAVVPSGACSLLINTLGVLSAHVARVTSILVGVCICVTAGARSAVNAVLAALAVVAPQMVLATLLVVLVCVAARVVPFARLRRRLRIVSVGLQLTAATIGQMVRHALCQMTVKAADVASRSAAAIVLLARLSAGVLIFAARVTGDRVRAVRHRLVSFGGRSAGQVAAEQEPTQNKVSCVVCYDRARSTLLLPCRHLCLCEACSDALLRQRPQCPVCRGQVECCVQVYV